VNGNLDWLTMEESRIKNVFKRTFLAT
jgi:hypothetical protein